PRPGHRLDPRRALAARSLDARGRYDPRRQQRGDRRPARGGCPRRCRALHHPPYRGELVTRSRHLLVPLLAAALVVAACGGDDDAETTPDPDGADAEATTVTLLTHDSFDVSDEVLAAFTEETGITVQLLPSGDAGSMI